MVTLGILSLILQYTISAELNVLYPLGKLNKGFLLLLGVLYFLNLLYFGGQNLRLFSHSCTDESEHQHCE